MGAKGAVVALNPYVKEKFMSSVQIKLIANAGILIEYQDQQILIDALHEGHRLYPGTSTETTSQLLDGHLPYKNVQALLFTHNHLDHFSPRLALAVLHRHADTVFISDKSSADELLALSRTISETFDTSRIKMISWHIRDQTQVELEPEPDRITVGSFDIQALSFEHEGRRFVDTANIGFLVTVGGVTILFPGDARIAPDNFKTFTNMNITVDAAVVMFPYIATGRGQTLIRDHLKPRRVIVVHWPDPVRDSQHFIANTRKYFERTKDQLMETVFLEKYLDTVEISAK